MRRLLRAIAALPLALRFVLLFAVVLHGCGIGWGLPASDAWDNDGVAPRDFLPGLAATFTPGEYYTYPPLHLALLSLLTAPITLVAVLRAGTTQISIVIHELLAPPYMTAFSLVARVVSLLMSLGIIVTLSAIASELTEGERQKRVRIATALFTSLNISFTYYAHMSNLDVPYLFWAFLGVLGITRAVRRHEPERFRSAFLFATLAVATKDQAYAMFVLAVPLIVAAWIAFDTRARSDPKRILRHMLVATALATLLLLLVDGAVFNPSGFRARVHFLTGSASQDYAAYTRDAAGRLSVLVDTVIEFRRHYPPIAGVFVGIGFVVALVRARSTGRSAFVAALVPLVVAVSFTLLFNMAARRVEERFTLPQMLGAAVYAGIGLEWVWTLHGMAVLRWSTRIATVAILVLSAWECARIDTTLLAEPRYGTERFLEANAAGQTVEVHGINVYLPRFPKDAKVTRVGPSDPARRGPIPGVEEVEARLSAIEERKPRFIVVSECYVWRYLGRSARGRDGHVVPSTQGRDANDVDATSFFQSLFRFELPYRLAREDRVENHWFPRAELHASLGCPMYVFERKADAP
mgnify:CR=1 FL=1